MRIILDHLYQLSDFLQAHDLATMRYKDAIEELKRYNDEVQEYLVEFKRSRLS